MHTRHGPISDRTATFSLTVILTAVLVLAAPAWSQTSTGSGGNTAFSAAASAHPLDGRRFSASIVRDESDEDGKKPPLGDTLTFSNGKFSSEVCRRYNFTDAPYWVRVEGDKIHFLVELKSPTDGTMSWQGTVRGDTLEGTMRWEKERWYWTINAKHRIRGKLAGGMSAAPPRAD